MAIPPPSCVSILLCDAIHVDRVTGNSTIFNTFNIVFAKSFPARHPELTLFAELTDGRGRTPIDVRFLQLTADAPDGIELLSATVHLEFNDPRSVVAFFVRFSLLALPRAGEYHFVLESSGQFIARRRLTAEVRA